MVNIPWHIRDYYENIIPVSGSQTVDEGMWTEVTCLKAENSCKEYCNEPSGSIWVQKFLTSLKITSNSRITQMHEVTAMLQIWTAI